MGNWGDINFPLLLQNHLVVEDDPRSQPQAPTKVLLWEIPKENSWGFVDFFPKNPKVEHNKDTMGTPKHA